jgi:hypothetical protein
MSLAMIRPFKHPKTGVYWLRKAVPAPLRAAVGKREMKRSLGTKDPGQARDRAPAVIAEFEAALTNARSGAALGAALTLREIAALTAEWYREAITEWGDNPDQFGPLDIYEELLHDQVERAEDGGDPDHESPLKLSSADFADAARLLRGHRFPTDSASVARLARAIFSTRFRLVGTLRRRLSGDWTADTTLDKSPQVVPREPPDCSPKVTFQALIAAWAAEKATMRPRE